MKRTVLYFFLWFALVSAKGQTSVSGCYLSGALIDPSSTAGCGNTPAYCNLASLFVPAFSPIACGTVVTTGGVSHTKGTSFVLPSGCTATVEAEFRKRNNLGVGSTSIGCSNSGMDGSPDGFSITQSGGVITSESSTMAVNVGTCGAYPTQGTYTTAVATLSPGCSNADGKLQMIVTGGTVSITGASNRADEIITYTLNMSGTCGPSCLSVLPIELMSFYGQVVEQQIELGWTVASEKNVDHYRIERSMDGLNYSVLGKVLSKNSTGNTNYFLTDYHPEKGINYYRINNHDKDGTEGTYYVIAIELLNETRSIRVDQDNEYLYINFSRTLKDQVLDLYDVTGRVIREIKLESENNRVNVNKESLKGIYILRSRTQAPLLNLKITAY